MFIMKALVLLLVLLSVALDVTAQAGGVVEAAPQEVKGDNQGDGSEVFSAGEMASSAEGRFFACPTGWTRYRNGCYLYVHSGRTWSSAAANCRSLGASLASVSDVFDYSFLQDLTMRSGNSVAWMGGFYFQGWRWVDQTPFTYNYWNSQNTVSRYQCVYLNARAGWSNHDCNNGWTSICMKRIDTC
ncbi:ladderlectin-like [Seriola aureovittata]|uniref:ladderlectin-like n=1 Tax=Seriola aureovittata TaxID=2871759 RepID=UPI0024BDD335|nr:ladderlectin-like [Seriola aureovittata]